MMAQQKAGVIAHEELESSYSIRPGDAERALHLGCIEPVLRGVTDDGSSNPNISNNQATGWLMPACETACQTVCPITNLSSEPGPEDQPSRSARAPERQSHGLSESAPACQASILLPSRTDRDSVSSL
ncbi:hypothetical protein G7Z17_g11764 [Cylindrodendrum hubeiense]|uniref:Uncharacterized protein n=1 Tax=Cylindrodendrum hubeiense TaxID=595255 RepID=A0A9P5GZL5_9HYPO|nr:hypothetical protein G7Z17_g11764 [Cylindrodendrum hubeiense]